MHSRRPRTSALVCTSHTRTTASAPADATNRPSAEKVTADSGENPDELPGFEPRAQVPQVAKLLRAEAHRAEPLVRHGQHL